MMETTNNDVYLQQQVKAQENKLLKISNKQNQIMLKLKRENMRVLCRLQHEKDICEIKQQTLEIEMESDKLQKEVRAYQQQSVKVINADNIRTLSEILSKAKATTILKKAEEYMKAATIEADIEVAAMKDTAAARLDVAKNRCISLKKISNAEQAQAINLQPLREFDQRMKMTSATDKVAEKGHMVVAGDASKEIFNFYNSTLLQTR